MKKQTRAGFLMSLLGLTLAPAVIGEVVHKDRNRIPEVPDYKRQYPLTPDECEVNISPGGLYTFCENNTKWRVGDIGQTDLGSYFLVTVVSRLDKDMCRVSVRPRDIGPYNEFKYKNLRDDSVKMQTVFYE